MPTPEVQVACARVADLPPRDWTELLEGLDADERERAQRFRFDADRRAYVLSHALLRALVARVTGRPASSVQLTHDAQGRPGVLGDEQLHISNSRTRQAAACAVTAEVGVGIDVEAIDPHQADADLLAGFVAPGPDGMQAGDFFMRWALLEAFWKAWGTGLAQGNPRVVITRGTSDGFDIRTEGGGERLGGTGWLLPCLPDCACALVLRGARRESVRLRQTRCASAMEINQLSSEMRIGRLPCRI